MTDQEFLELVESKTIRRIEFKATVMPLCGNPIVYMACGKDSVLYVGMSAKGLERVFGKGHHVLSHITSDIVNIQVFQTATEKDARELETALIREFKPIHNGRRRFPALRIPSGCSKVAEIITSCGY